MFDFDRTLYGWAVTYPAETVPIFDGQLAAIAAEAEGLDPEELTIQVGMGARGGRAQGKGGRRAGGIGGGGWAVGSPALAGWRARSR